MVKEIFKFSIRRLIQTKINGGIVLLFVALAAMLIANSPLQEYYNILLSKNTDFPNSCLCLISFQILYWQK